MAGLSARIGEQGKVLFSYQGSATKNKEDAFNGVKGKLSTFSLCYVHNLSKRTNFCAVVLYGSGKLNFDKTENIKLKSTLLGTGMTHSFLTGASGVAPWPFSILACTFGERWGNANAPLTWAIVCLLSSPWGYMIS
ncbi:hypothetical protein [Advenella incenata]|uniref:hypothetical protein n=1 Tax=Advenella incenata TaxID=267800 RepID=UPI0010297F37|nr:hypothetical protein [Advenella incenata]